MVVGMGLFLITAKAGETVMGMMCLLTVLKGWRGMEICSFDVELEL
jgi:hypothetical protein